MSSVKLSPEAADQQSKLATQKALFELGKQTANKEQSGSGKILGFKNGSSISR